MKLRVFYDSNGVIQSVAHINPKAGMQASIAAASSHLDIDMKKAGANSPGEIHACFRVDAHGGLYRHSERKLVAISERPRS
ncbi:hypothetical protein [Paraburkholderia sp. PGU16]|jgi:hypothetical protein|uniref:hypothetical protein n=1 Tax=Paraburkholderia TaxID=1822464 RepID=UPI0015DB1DCF|nr:hypothetical protein [Paraburkholderia sp. PGU16]BEU26581.1 hypothetical protein PBP221_67210 [Paraburkholderia sp. 22B1P]GJH32301.1 hypothetical protein CBA19CS91_06110 [Paraburkholderia hospita]